ncbi:hypothetical protein [Nocardia takedensis]|uniref:hypothetical protein n=1 Tax=Nocardia takedensis TaxID=259390 RepID=UPI001FE21986|nr:hypothetical protein [Nocardia takedensis]
MAAELYEPQSRVDRTSLIAAEGWIADQPIDLDSLELRLSEGRRPAVVDGTGSATEALRPWRTDTERFESYSAAIRHLDRPRLFDSRPSYRLLSGDPRGRVLEFGLAEYFDKVDLCEAVAHELAAECMERGLRGSDVRGRLRFRSEVGDPFDARRRALIPAVTTLTIRLRRHPEPASFLLHWRDPARVVTASGMYDVIPAGEFQPSSIALWDRRNDFSLWRNIVREYSEELLGQPEHDGSRAIDYESWPLYQALGEARQQGKVTAHVLGLGLDALSLAATILTVVVIDDDVFEDIFGATVRFNDEGEVVAIGDGRAADGVPFTREAVDRLLDTEPVAAPGAACLWLAWQHRHTLID